MLPVLTADKVRLALVEEDRQAEADGDKDAVLHTDITASMFIQQGIDLEDARYALPTCQNRLSLIRLSLLANATLIL